MSEINKKWGVTDFVLERTCPEKHLNLSIKDVRARISNTDFFLKILRFGENMTGRTPKSE